MDTPRTSPPPSGAPPATEDAGAAEAGTDGDGATSAERRTDGAGAAGRDDRDARTAPRRLAERALLAVPALVLLERAWDHRWMTDDGFINLRVVRMILDGHGPVFNAGERVEVTTSPLWVWILAAADVVLPVRLEWIAVLLGLVGAVGGLALATYGAARLHRAAGATGLLVPAGAAALAVVSPIWDFSTSGLEGGLTFGWLGLTGFLLARWAAGDGRDDTERGLGAPSAALIGLGPLVRPDLALVVLPVLVAVLVAQWRDDRLRDRVRLVASAAAIPVAYQVFRMAYFASLVPNTALAKAGSRSRWGTGFAYLRDLVQPYWLVLPLAALLLVVLVPLVVRSVSAGRRRVAAALAALPVGGLLDGLYIVRVGGDYMHGRLLLPALFALLVPVAAVPLHPFRAPRPRPTPEAGPAPEVRPARGLHPGLAATGAVAVTLAWSLVCLAWLRPGGTPAVDGLFSSDARAGNVRQFGEHAVTAADQGFGPGPPQSRLDPSVAMYVEGRPVPVDPPDDLPTPASTGYGVGITGYAYGTDVYIIDLLGLGDAVTARFELTRPGPTGHEKPIPPVWLAARISTGPVDPDVLPPPRFGAPLYESPAGRFDADADAARAALRCGDLRELAEATREPLTLGRALSNIVAAPRFTRLEVPPDPSEARRRFCGE